MGRLLAGVLPGLVASYFLPALPLAVLVALLLVLAALAVRLGELAGVAFTVATVLAVFVVIQDPAVECGDQSVSTSDGPWWLESPQDATASGSGRPDGVFEGTTQVGDHQYLHVP